jgi:hypothetical protein
MATPFAPTLLTVNHGSYAKGVLAHLSWIPNNNALTGYGIYRGPTAGSEVLIATIGASLNHYEDFAVTQGVTYYYKVSALNASGEGPKSNEIPLYVQIVAPLETCTTTTYPDPSTVGGGPGQVGVESYDLTGADQLGAIDGLLVLRSGDGTYGMPSGLDLSLFAGAGSGAPAPPTLTDVTGAGMFLHRDFSVAVTLSPAYEPPEETDLYYARLPHHESGDLLVRRPQTRTGVLLARRGLDVPRRRRRNALVRNGSALMDVIGERLKITTVGEPVERSVYAYVHDVFPADRPDSDAQLSLTRQLFQRLTGLGMGDIDVVVEVMV